MSIFISHVEENRATAEAIARGLEAAGYDAWSYEFSSVPGPTYLSQVMDAIEKASAVILVISPEALGSHQVAREIEAAHELDRPIIPVLQGITHEKYLQRRPEWRLALGAYTSIEVPPEGVDAIMPKLVGGLEALGVARGTGPVTPLVPPAPSPGSQGGDGLRAAMRKPWVMVIAAVLVTALAAVVAVVLLGSGDDQTAGPALPTTPTSFPTDGAIPELTQPLDKVKATLEVEPRTAYSDGTLTMSYSITNTSDVDLKASTTSISLLVGLSSAGSAVVLNDISQDIGAGATVTGTVQGSLVGANPGPQTVWIDVGQRIHGGSTGDVQLAQVPITVKR